jgi:RNA-directed DNA polymerase
MTKTPSSLQDLRRSLYVKAKAESTWRFWGLYVHVCKMETLYEAYRMAKENDGAPGIDGVTFESIAESGVENFQKQIRDELVSNTYRPMGARKKEIPKDGGKVRVLSIPSIRDRVVQGALKLILEPIFEADFQPGSYGYRPKRTAHQAVNRVGRRWRCCPFMGPEIASRLDRCQRLPLSRSRKTSLPPITPAFSKCSSLPCPSALNTRAVLQ